MFDSGLCKIYSVENAAAPGMMPTETLTLKAECFFEERTVGVSRYYAAKQNTERIDIVIRIWQNRDIKVSDICEVYGGKYVVRQAQQTSDDDGMLVTDLALEGVG